MPPVFYLDLWPAANSFMMVHDPEVAAQMTQTKNLPKHPINFIVLGPLVGERSVVTAEGAEWKLLRSILNPGFSAQYLSTLIPLLVRHGMVFKENITKYASTGEVFPVQETATNLTFDVISEVVLGINPDSQRGPNKLARHFNRAITWSVGSLDVVSWNLARPFKWWHCRQQDMLIEQMIRERHAETRSTNAPGTKAAVDLFLQTYRDEKLGASTTRSATDELDPDFLLIARNNIKTLLLGGHDTTASSLAYTLALLFEPENAPDLARIRAEHDFVFGTDPSQAMARLLADPRLLNTLPLTTAAIKESMRLYPAGSTTRATVESHPLQTVTVNGQTLPLADQQIWINHYGISQRAEIWPSPRKFILDRFLPNPSDPALTPPRDAWRPFEKGPRGCLGLELAMTEMRLVLVLLCREFEFELAYPKDAPRAPEGHGVQGGRGYQILEFAAKPASHMPVRVKRRKI
jgi:sterigmatocystin biosynthesis cytochrome P450 monooxygenase